MNIGDLDSGNALYDKFRQYDECVASIRYMYGMSNNAPLYLDGSGFRINISDQIRVDILEIILKYYETESKKVKSEFNNL
jgi:hypothetical protein